MTTKKKSKASSESIVRQIKRMTRRKFTAEEKIRIVLDGLRGEESITDICRKEGIHPTMYHKWSKGWSEWKRQSGYYLQSHAENAFYRYKRIIGGRLRAKNDDAQKLEAAIGCVILRMLEMGEPLFYAVG